MSDVCLVTNLPAPYRLPVFEEVNEHHRLSVKFLRRSDASRNWAVDPDEYDFDREFLAVGAGPTLRTSRAVSSVFDEDYDVCIVGESARHAPILLSVLRAARRKGVPRVIWTEGVEIAHGRPGTVAEAVTAVGRRAYDATVRRYTYSLADAFVAYSGVMTRRFLEARGIDGTRIHAGTQVMPRSLLGARDDPGDDHGTGSDPTTILSLGYLRRAKGVDVLVEAFEGLGRPDAELVVAGDGPDRERLESLAAGVENVRFTGFVTGDAKWDLYREADLFVLPTFRDTWGLVVNEALFFGTPVIATEAAGASQLVDDNDAGTVVPARDPDRLRDAMAELLDSPERRSACARNAAACETAWDPAVGGEPFLRAIDRVDTSRSDCARSQ